MNRTRGPGCFAVSNRKKEYKERRKGRVVTLCVWYVSVGAPYECVVCVWCMSLHVPVCVCGLYVYSLYCGWVHFMWYVTYGVCLCYVCVVWHMYVHVCAHVCTMGGMHVYIVQWMDGWMDGICVCCGICV